MNIWDEKNFFEKACLLRKKILESDSELKDIEINVLSKIVEQVFREGTLPDFFVFPPYPRRSHSDFFSAVDNVFSSLDMPYTKSKQIISAYVTQNNYLYTNDNYNKIKRRRK